MDVLYRLTVANVGAAHADVDVQAAQLRPLELRAGKLSAAANQLTGKTTELLAQYYNVVCAVQRTPRPRTARRHLV
jgi:hypothetical protein